MTNGNIFLIGGGEITKGETKEIDKDIMKLVPRGSVLVFFGTATDDSGGYNEAIKKAFGGVFKYCLCH